MRGSRKINKWFLVCLLGLTSCTTYRLNYVASVTLESDRTAENDSEDPPQYLYKYGESFSNSFLGFGCPLTVIAYGGLCWMYAGLPWASDDQAATENAHKNLDKIFGPGKYTLSDEQVIKTGYDQQEPRYLLYDHNSEVISRGTPENATPIVEIDLKKRPLITDEVALEAPRLQYEFWGLELKAFSGTASVRSSVTENGLDYTVAAGDVDHEYAEVVLGQPQNAGFFWGIMPNYSYHKMAIKDFASYLPIIEIANTDNIPIVVTDPKTKQTIAIEDYTNSYNIKIQNMGLLVGAGYGIKGPYEHGKPSWSLSGGLWLAAVQYFWTHVEYEHRDEKIQYFDFFNGYRFELNAYYNIPRWSSAIGVHYNYLYYPHVRMPDNLEFRGPPRFNEDKQVYERQRLFLNTVKFSSSAIGLSYTYIIKEYDTQ